MENSYGIGVTNRYAMLFNMDDEPGSGAAPAAGVAAAKKQAKPAKKPAATSAAGTLKPANTNQSAHPLSTNNKGTNQEKENKVSQTANNKSDSTGKANAAKNRSGGAGGGPKDSQTQRNTLDRNNRDDKGPRDSTGRPNKPNNSQANGETREQRNNRRNRDNVQQNGVAGNDFNNRDDKQVRRGGAGGGGAGGPPRRTYEGRGKREFDRQSGSDKTGVKPMVKRDGAGAHNWGSHKQDIDDVNAKPQSQEFEGDKSGDKDGENTTSDTKLDTDQPMASEEETKELTLDEWKAQRAIRAKPQYNLRKAGEGEDTSQWKKMVALNNKKKDEESEEELEYDPLMYPQRVGRQKHVLDIEFHFNDGRRGGMMGRGRGRPRGAGQPGGHDGGSQRVGGGGGGGGGGGRGGGEAGGQRGVGRNRNVNPREDKQHRAGGQDAPKVDDENAFPSLG